MALVMEQMMAIPLGRSGHKEEWSVRGEMVFPPDRPAYFGLEWTRLFQRWEGGDFKHGENVKDDEIFAFIIPAGAAVIDIYVFIAKGFENVCFGRPLDFCNLPPCSNSADGDTT